MVYEVKYKSTPIGSMDAIKLKAAASALLAKIHIITGWGIPEGTEYQAILKDQFCKKLVESFPNVNTDEIEYAFRNYPVKEWGKNMNLNLIAEVMEPYLEKRREVSRLEEQVKTKQELPPAGIEPMPDDEFIQMNYDVWKALKNYQAISPKCYDILFTQEKIKRVEGEEREFVIKKSTTDLHEELRQTGEVLSYENKEKRIQALCKKLVVQKYFNSL